MYQVLLSVEKLMAVAIFAIAWEQKELESCGFQYSKEEAQEHKITPNLIGLTMRQLHKVSRDYF